MYMGIHRVNLSTHGDIDVTNSDFEFEVFEDDLKLGTLKVSRGSVDWFPRDNKKTHFVMDWADLIWRS